MKRKSQKWIAHAMGIVLLFGLCACDANEAKNAGGIKKLSDVRLWSVNSSVKVRQEDIEYADKGPASLSYTCVKGETESVQLMLTPSKEIKSYELKASALTDGKGNSIPADAFEIYAESYLNITLLANSSTLYPAGAYPDALIPMEYSKAAGENTVEKDKNQGLWVLVNVDRETAAGTYSGAFTLTMDSVTTKIPVSVTVYDVVMPEEATMGTIFLNRRANVMMGEHDGTEAMMVRYFEQMLDYRITLCDVPVYSGDATEYAEFIDKYFDNPNLTTYIIPYKSKTSSSDTLGSFPSIDMEFFKAHVKALADKSTAERDLVKDAMLYIYSITDEPEMNGGEYIVCEISKELERAKQEAVNELLRSDPDYFNGRENVKESILNLRNIITGGVDSLVMRGSVNTYCPMLNLFHTEQDRQKIYDVCEQYGSELWWYGCIAPRNPFCTYHIDDNLLGSRLLSWMQADYDIVGNLYYDISSYAMASNYDNNLIVPCNPYKDPYRWDNVQAVNGDGFLVYPGSKYDHFGFLPSIRLMSIRDGMEEYELLEKLETDYAGLSNFYNMTIDSESILEGMYKKLYTGTIPTTDTALFDSMRLELLDKLAEANSESKFLIEKMDVRGENASVSLLLSNAYSLKVNGETMQNMQQVGGGYRYTLQLDLSKGDNWLDIEITNKQNASDVTKVRRYLGGRTKTVNAFEATAYSGITLSDRSSFSVNTDVANSLGGNSLYAELRSIIKEDEAFNQNFYPTLKMKNVDWAIKPQFNELSTLEFDIKNVGEKPFTVTVNLIAGNQMRAVGSFIVGNTGEFTHISLDVAANTWSKLSSVDGIALTFANSGTVELPDVYRFYLDNMFVTYKQEVTK